MSSGAWGEVARHQPERKGIHFHALSRRNKSTRLTGSHGEIGGRSVTEVVDLQS